MKALKASILFAVVLTAGPVFADDAQSLWTGKCKSCHAEKGNADTRLGREKKIADLSAAAWQSKKSDAEIKKVISEGVADTKMKPYAEKLSEGEIASLVAHIRGFKK